LDAHTCRLRALKIISGDEQTPRATEGVRTEDLEVTLPSGEFVELGRWLSFLLAASRSVGAR
jgi:hypothetical protein